MRGAHLEHVMYCVLLRLHRLALAKAESHQRLDPARVARYHLLELGVEQPDGAEARVVRMLPRGGFGAARSKECHR